MKFNLIFNAAGVLVCEALTFNETTKYICDICDLFLVNCIIVVSVFLQSMSLCACLSAISNADDDDDDDILHSCDNRQSDEIHIDLLTDESEAARCVQSDWFRIPLRRSKKGHNAKFCFSANYMCTLSHLGFRVSGLDFRTPRGPRSV